jgi:hypothetical protein
MYQVRAKFDEEKLCSNQSKGKPLFRRRPMWITRPCWSMTSSSEKPRICLYRAAIGTRCQWILWSETFYFT